MSFGRWSRANVGQWVADLSVKLLRDFAHLRSVRGWPVHFDHPAESGHWMMDGTDRSRFVSDVLGYQNFQIENLERDPVD